MRAIIFTNPENTQGRIVHDYTDTSVPQETSGPIPPNAGDVREVYERLLADGVEPTLWAPPALTLDDYKAAIEQHIHTTVRERDYDGAVSAVSYILPDPTAEGVTPEEQKWDAEGRAVQRWRNAVWKLVFAELAKVLSGEREQPTIKDLIAELPQIAWPS